MKTLTTTLLFSSVLALVTSCSPPPPERNEYGQTFCTCNIVHTDIKRDLATEPDPEIRAGLELELEVLREQCVEFLPAPGEKESKEHMHKRLDCQ